MQGQVVRAGERALTQMALERPVARVFSEMTRQLIGTGEFPSASLPVTVVRFLTWWNKAEESHLGGLKTQTEVKGAVCNFFNSSKA